MQNNTNSIGLNIKEYFSNLWLSEKQSEIFLSLYKLWNQPASVIAKHLNMDRTTVYKTLVFLAEENLVSVTEKNKIKHFFISDISVIKKYIKNKQNKFLKLENEFNLVEAELSRYDKNFSSKLPQISIYDWTNWIKNIFDDILENIVKNNYLSIKMFASNILDSHIYSKSNISDYNSKFFEQIKKRNIHIDVSLGNWNLIMERVTKNVWLDSIENLPATDSAINIFVVGTVVYIIIFKSSPFAIRMESEEFADSLYFMMDNLKSED